MLPALQEMTGSAVTQWGDKRNFVRLAIIINDVHELQETMQPKKRKKKERTKRKTKQRQRKQGV